MKGIELTRTGQYSTMIWLPVDNITSVQPYIGFDGQIVGTEVSLNSGRSVKVEEDYTTIAKKLKKL